MSKLCNCNYYDNSQNYMDSFINKLSCKLNTDCIANESKQQHSKTLEMSLTHLIHGENRTWFFGVSCWRFIHPATQHCSWSPPLQNYAYKPRCFIYKTSYLHCIFIRQLTELTELTWFCGRFEQLLRRMPSD